MTNSPVASTNYITAGGAKKLQEELVRLRTKDRPKVVRDVADAAAQGDRSENAEYIYGKRKLREIDRRMHFLTKRLELVEVVALRDAAEPRIFFGATIDLEDEDGKRATYRIVGEDEIDLSRGRVSWRSPIGRVLLKHQKGDTVVLKRPSGDVELTILAVRYEEG